MGVTMQIYTVVDVMSGVAVGAKSFHSLKQAQTYLKRIRRGRNVNEDDVQLFEDEIASPTEQPGAAPVKGNPARRRRR